MIILDEFWNVLITSKILLIQLEKSKSLKLLNYKKPLKLQIQLVNKFTNLIVEIY